MSTLELSTRRENSFPGVLSPKTELGTPQSVGEVGRISQISICTIPSAGRYFENSIRTQAETDADSPERHYGILLPRT
mgnify:CR=1 FL=1